MSSDSEEDCYGHAARRLQKLKNSYRPPPPPAPAPPGVGVAHSAPAKPDFVANTNSTALNDSYDDGIPERVVLPPLLPAITIPSSPIVSKRRTRNSARAQNSSNAVNSPLGLPTKRGRKRKGTTVEAIPPPQPHLQSLPPPVVPTQPPADTATRGRNRARGGRSNRGNQRGRGRCRGGNRRSGAGLLDAFMNIMSASNMIDPIIYSIGNTLEYEDTSVNQPLFSNQARTNTNNDVVLMGDGDLSSSFDDENEELSVKVYWQSMEYVKFNIRRFQKLTQIFDFFSKRENVSQDNLLFTLGDKILKANDTPDSINYNIGLFIDGGIVNCSVANIVPGRSSKENIDLTSGITIKFQCQNVKRPFEANIETNQKFLTAMAKCAEHFELPIARLKFFFDGDQLSSGSTPADHDMEGGECVDVNITS